MKQSRISTLIAAAGLLTALPAAWAAPGDPAPATPAAPASPVTPTAGTPMRGQVTAVDATAKTVTVQDRNQNTTVLHLSDTTKYLVDATGAMSDVKAGQTVRVMGQTDGTTIAARMIQVVPPEEAGVTAPGGGGGGGRRYGTLGVVATVTPSLTITTADKQTDTVTTDSTTRVTTSHAGTLADVKPQSNVSAITTGSGDSVTASLIHVRAAYGRPGGAPTAGGAAPAPGATPTPGQ